jgi:hypothetical protein
MRCKKEGAVPAPGFYSIKVLSVIPGDMAQGIAAVNNQKPPNKILRYPRLSVSGT